MTAVVGVGIAVAVILFLYALFRRDSSEEASRYGVTVTFNTYDPAQYRARNEVREQWLRERYPEADKLIFSKIAGVTHRNRNGSDRQMILERCSAREELRLIPEPDNRFDPNAVAVCRENGEQLGYLGRRLAEEMCGWMDKGEHWSVVLTQVTGIDKQTLGANIALLRKRPSEVQAEMHHP